MAFPLSAVRVLDLSHGERPPRHRPYGLLPDEG
jgi:hypothetical protein